jgi:hypothetical protein
MPGIDDLTGRKFGTIRVQGMVARRPEPRYSIVCEQCSTTSTATHTRLRDGAVRCQFSGCGKPVAKRGPDLLAEQRRRLAEQEAERAAAEVEAAELRMAAEVDSLDFDQREAVRLAAEEQKATEAREAAEAAQREREDRQQRYWAEWVQSDPDPKLSVSDAMRSASLPTKDVAAHNTAAAEEFIQSTPEFAEYKTPENADKILAYFDRNGVKIFDKTTLKAAFVRLRDLGILEKQTAPQTQPEEQPKRVNLTVSPAPSKPASGPKTYKGRDYATGLEREFTRREVDRMSSAEYARAFPTIQTVAELFTQLNESR